MKAIIFSKNRAMQLDALLKSARTYAPQLSFIVIYTYSSEDFSRGYDILIQEYPEVVFVKETIFKVNLLDSIKRHLDQAYIFFFCDDDVFYGEDIFLKKPQLKDDELCYSLRLGKNVTHFFMGNKSQRNEFESDGACIRWNWIESEGDFAWPFSVDGQMYRISDVLPIIEREYFLGPYDFEYIINSEIKNVPAIISNRKMMRSSIHSTLVGIPDNTVHKGNYSSGGSAYKLNILFLEGKRCDPFSMDFSNIIGAHQEIPYKISSN
jgi:hypothetical protein